MRKLRLPRVHWRRFRDWRVGTKLIVPMLVLALLPIAIVSASAQRTLSDTLTNAQERALVNESRGLTEELNGVLGKGLALTTLTASNPVLARYAAAAPADRAQYEGAVNQQLQALREQDPTFEVAGIVTLDGVWSIDQTAPGVQSIAASKVNVGFRDYFQNARAGRPFISDIQVSLTSNQPSLYFAAPLRDETNQVVGVLALRTSTAVLQRIVSRHGGDHQAMLIDNEGIILLHSSDNAKFQYHSVAPLTPAQQQAVATLKRFGNTVREVTPLNMRGFGEALRAGRQTGGFTYTLDGAPYYASMAPVPGTTWRAVTAVSAGTFSGAVWLEAQRNLLLGVLIAIAAVILAVLVARQVTRPLGELEGAARRIAAGDYDVRVPVRTRDELGEVAVAVNSMVDRITAIARRQETEHAALQQQIMRLLDEVSTVAEGDLTVEAEVTAGALGALADSFNYMIGELRQIVGRVNDVTRQVAESTEQVLVTTGALTRATEQQAARVAETSAAVETMAGSIQQVSANAAVSARVARDAHSSAEAGAQAVAATVAGMGRIRDQVRETAKKIKQLGESSQEIGAIVSLIQDVADRTELLALNAAIQAAMAGEHGKGFAVVAEEVRRLAERTSEASKQITTLVKNIQAETTDAVVAMEEGTREVVAGSRLADEAGQSLQAIDTIVGQLAELIEAISLAAEQQARASAGIARAMNEISEVTHGTAVGTEHAAASVATLARLATDLRASVAAFRLGDDTPEERAPAATEQPEARGTADEPGAGDDGGVADPATADTVTLTRV